jgi:hypothetical protein
LTATSTSTASATVTATPVPPGILLGHVTWEGIPQPDDRNAGIPGLLTLCVAGDPRNYPVTTDANGYFTVAVDLPPGTYNWRFKNDRALASSGRARFERMTLGILQIPLPGAAKSPNLPTAVELGVQRAGDANDDNTVDVLDFNTLKGTFGLVRGQPGFDPRADFDRDNVVDVLDFNLLKGNFGRPGAAPNCP